MKPESPKDSRTHTKMLSKPFSRLKSYLIGKISDTIYKTRYRNFRPSYSSDAAVCGIDKHVASLATFLKRGDIERFLGRLFELTHKLSAEPLMGRALYLPELDELTRKASLVVASTPNPPTHSRLLVHLATTVYTTGGHTRIIEDIAVSLPEFRHVLILTGVCHPDPFPAALRLRFDELGVTVRLLQTLTWVEKVRELSSLITTLRPQAILLNAHHYDSVAYAGVAGCSAPRVLFLHHADHAPSLGATRVDYTHIDLTPACHCVCLAQPRLHASLINLTAQDIGTATLADRPHIVGVTCGSPHKYAGSSEFSYGQLLAALFSAGVDQIFHVGDMPDAQKDLIASEIMANGEDPRRIIFLPNTPSLAAKLVEISPDFYLTSHPIGAGKATIEALSVGIPILYVCPASTLPLLNPDMTLATSVPLSALEEVPAAVHRLETEKKALAIKSREIYEKHYSTKTFRDGLISAINLDPTKSGPATIP